MNELVSKFLNMEHQPIKFRLYNHGRENGEYYVSFHIIEVDKSGNDLPDRAFFHVFEFDGSGNSYRYDQERDKQAWINCLRDIVLDGQYTNMDENNRAMHSYKGGSSDIYIDRFKFDIFSKSFTYSRPPENLARERILLRYAVIKAIYGSGIWVEWLKLLELVRVEPEDLRQTCDYLVSAMMLEEFETNKYKLTASGYTYFEKQILPSSNTVFIIASCAKEHGKWIKYYESDIESSGFKPFFMEQEEPPREIIIKIYEQIKNCAFVLADITGGSENCLYELGYAHALDKRIILIRDVSEVKEKKEDKIRLTFDLNQFKHSLRYNAEDWESEDNKAFRTELKDRINQVKIALFETQFFHSISDSGIISLRG